MRKGLVGVGIVLAIVGAVLLFVPLFPSTISVPASNTAGNGGTIGYNVYASSFSLVGGTSGTFAFSAPTSVDIAVITCTNAVTTSQLGQVTSDAQFNADCGTNTTYGTSSINGISFSNGTAGSFAVHIPSGGSLVWFALSGQSSPPTVTVTMTLTSPLGGLVLLVLGIVLLLVGVVLKSKKPKTPPGTPMAPQPWTPPGQPAPAGSAYAQAPPSPPGYAPPPGRWARVEQAGGPPRGLPALAGLWNVRRGPPRPTAERDARPWGPPTVP